MLRKITFAVLAVMVLILAYAATKPNSFRVQRSVAINAPSEKVFALVNDFHNWSAWSPWEKLDPAMKRTHSGAASGKGAVYAWKGNSDVGAATAGLLKIRRDALAQVERFTDVQNVSRRVEHETPGRCGRPAMISAGSDMLEGRACSSRISRAGPLDIPERRLPAGASGGSFSTAGFIHTDEGIRHDAFQNGRGFDCGSPFGAAFVGGTRRRHVSPRAAAPARYYTAAVFGQCRSGRETG